MDEKGLTTRADWLTACRRATDTMRTMFADRATTAERAVETGTTGHGGDHTLEIDDAAETIVFAELQRLYDDGHRFHAISEERGDADFGGDDVVVVIDPIDGSLNAKRGLAHHALSLAVAAGQTMADVEFGYVYDFGTGEEFFVHCRDAFDWLYRLGSEGRPRMMSIGLHGRIIGRPSRMGALARLLDHIQRHEAVWICNRAAIARHWIALTQPSHAALP